MLRLPTSAAANLISSFIVSRETGARLLRRVGSLPEEPPFGELPARGGGGGGGGGASKVVTSVKTKRSGGVASPLRSNDAMKTSASTSAAPSEPATQRRCRTVNCRTLIIRR